MSANHDRATGVGTPASGEPSSSLLRSIPPLIIQAQNAFCRDLPHLLQERKGQWVVYHGDRQVLFAKTYAEALKGCHRHYLPQDEYVIYRVEEECDLEPIDPSTLD